MEGEFESEELDETAAGAARRVARRRPRRCRSASACSCRTSGRLRRRCWRLAACQRCNWRKHVGSRQYRWFQHRGKKTVSHPFRWHRRGGNREALAEKLCESVDWGCPMGGATPVGAARRTLCQSFGHLFVSQSSLYHGDPSHGPAIEYSWPPGLGHWTDSLSAPTSPKKGPHTTKSGGEKDIRKDTVSICLDSRRIQNPEGDPPEEPSKREGYRSSTAGHRSTENTGVFHPGPTRPIILFELTARGMPKDTSLDAMWEWFDLAHVWIVKGFADLTSTDVRKNIWKQAK